MCVSNLTCPKATKEWHLKKESSQVWRGCLTCQSHTHTQTNIHSKITHIFKSKDYKNIVNDSKIILKQTFHTSAVSVCLCTWKHVFVASMNVNSNYLSLCDFTITPLQIQASIVQRQFEGLSIAPTALHKYSASYHWKGFMVSSTCL